ncbi:MAG: DNA internalization-related competence protein ComEC/Rec2 [Gammaproteobacteria bacterium]|nr:DNA internalization-related competence protein ComEC/Rec2 [Gammaproteobacteria bacterium]
MRAPLIAFAAGVFAAHLQPVPAVAAAVIGGASAVLVCVAAARVPAFVGLGFAWAGLAIAAALPPPDRDVCDTPVALVVAVEGLPVREEPAMAPAGAGKGGVAAPEAAPMPGGRDASDQPLAASVRFEGRVLRTATCGPQRGERLRLGWTAPDVPLPRPGQHWRVEAKIEAARGHANAFVFDYERWLVRHRIAFTGYITAGTLRADSRDGVDDWRIRLRERMEARRLEHGGAILALATGDTALVSPEAWRLLRDTGTVHLLVISGLHVGMFAVLGMGAGNALARVLPVTRRFRARAVGGIVAALAVVGYATAAGWTLPVTRAALMTGVGILAATVGRRARVSDAFALALAGLLAVDPLAVLDTGFWLSFGAVGVLLAWFAPRTPRRIQQDPGGPVRRLAGSARRRATELIAAQAVVAVGFAPLLGGFVGHVHALAPAVNLVLIPLVATLGAPLSVLGGLLLAVLPDQAGPLLAVADRTLGLAMLVIRSAAAVEGIPAGVGTMAVPGAVALAMAFLLPWSRLAHAGVAAVALVVLTRPEPGLDRGFGVTVLDVGQGTAAVVRTRSQLLLYDTGPRYPSGFDVGEAVVAPYLRRAHRGRVTELVLSHSDIDHVGGAAAVQRLAVVRGTTVGEPVPGLGGRLCRAGDRWLWNGVRFRVLSPFPGHGGNDASCVIEVDDGRRRALLAGDIERAAERRMTVRRATFLLVPHHGSRTSSTPAFVNGVCPRFAVVTAGFRNRFGHPHPEVLERYRSVGAHVLETASLGSIEWRSDAPDLVRVGRDDRRYWRVDAQPGFAGRVAVGAFGPASCRGEGVRR